jgi:hypothetical protein
MIIIGAGLAGLLAANMLQHKDPITIEKQSSLPNNHSAVLRFRSSIVSDVTGIPFKKVEVIKGSLPWLNPIADTLAYAEKNTGVLRSDRSLPLSVTSSERYIAPSDLIERLASNILIDYDVDQVPSAIISDRKPIISTIPMPALMKMLGYPRPQKLEFHSVSGLNIKATVANCDAYASLYVPNPFYPFSRLTLTGNEFIAELPHSSAEHFDDYELIYPAAKLLGIERERLSNIKAYSQHYAKILPIDEGERTRFITWATDNYNVFSLGRFACWRPKTLLDDLVQDIRLIERWINSGSYAMRKVR